MKIVINSIALQKIKYWVHKAEGEISGMGLVEIKDGCFYVSDTFLAKQKNTGASTDIDAQSIGELAFDLISQNRLGETSQLKFWWHSHANMPVFWSGTDTNTIQTLSETWLIATVFNKKWEIKSCFHQNNIATPLGMTTLFKDNIEFAEENLILPEWELEYNKNNEIPKQLPRRYSYAQDYEEETMFNWWKEKEEVPEKVDETLSEDELLRIGYMYGYGEDEAISIKEIFSDDYEAAMLTGYSLFEIDNFLKIGFTKHEIINGTVHNGR